MRKKAIILIGAPGSGKGTQAEFLKEENYKHFIQSDLIKREIKSSPELKKIIDSGNLISNEECIYIFEKHLEIENKIMLDGYPRTKEQSIHLLSFMLKHSYDFKVIFIDVSLNELIKRIEKRGKEEGRADDNIEIFKNTRYKIFEETKEVIFNYFKDIIIKINGEGKPEDISKEIKSKLKEIGFI